MAKFLSLSNLPNMRVSEELWFWFRTACQLKTIKYIHIDKLKHGQVHLVTILHPAQHG